jgi:hypothetical protein
MKDFEKMSIQELIDFIRSTQSFSSLDEKEIQSFFLSRRPLELILDAQQIHVLNESFGGV